MFYETHKRPLDLEMTGAGTFHQRPRRRTHGRNPQDPFLASDSRHTSLFLVT